MVMMRQIFRHFLAGQPRQIRPAPVLIDPIDCSGAAGPDQPIWLELRSLGLTTPAERPKLLWGTLRRQSGAGRGTGLVISQDAEG